MAQEDEDGDAVIPMTVPAHVKSQFSTTVIRQAEELQPRVAQWVQLLFRGEGRETYGVGCVPVPSPPPVPASSPADAASGGLASETNADDRESSLPVPPSGKARSAGDDTAASDDVGSRDGDVSGRDCGTEGGEGEGDGAGAGKGGDDAAPKESEVSTAGSGDDALDGSEVATEGLSGGVVPDGASFVINVDEVFSVPSGRSAFTKVALVVMLGC